MSTLAWSEPMIARALAMQTFNRKYLVVVPNCIWTGYECDILAVTENLRLIDVEIKISRSDLKADAGKDKWVDRKFLGFGPEENAYKDGRLVKVSQPAIYDEIRIQWPRKVWKHYYAVPAEVWSDALFDSLGSPASGVLLLDHDGSDGVRVRVARPATPNRDAEKISAAAAVDIARLASLRMWNALGRLGEAA